MASNRTVRYALLSIHACGAIAAGVLAALQHEAAVYVLWATVGLGVAIVTLLSPSCGLHAFVVAVLTEGVVMLGSMSAARLLGILLLGSVVVHSLGHGRLRIAVPPQTWIAAAFVMWGFLSSAWIVDTRGLTAPLMLQLQLLALYIVVANVPVMMKEVPSLVAVVVLSSLSVALAAVAQLLWGVTLDGRVTLSRLFGGDPNIQAAHLLPGALCLMVMFASVKRSARKWMLLSGFSLVALAIMSTGSRAALVALITVMALGVLVERKLWQAAVSGIGLLGLVSLVMPHGFADRVKSILTLSDRAAGRFDIWRVAYEMIRDRPILGVGLGGFESAFDAYLPAASGLVDDVGSARASHNVYLNVQSELGVVGLLLFVALVAVGLRRGLQTVLELRSTEHQVLHQFALAVWLSLIAILVVGLFLDVQYWKLFWLLLALQEVTRLLSARIARQGAAR